MDSPFFLWNETALPINSVPLLNLSPFGCSSQQNEESGCSFGYNVVNILFSFGFSLFILLFSLLILSISLFSSLSSSIAFSSLYEYKWLIFPEAPKELILLFFDWYISSSSSSSSSSSLK